MGRADQSSRRRPSRRVNQWSASIQRELFKNVVVELAYVGNRGEWLEANNLVNYNATELTRLQQLGLDLNNPADRALLLSRIDSPLAASRGFTAPYAGYPGSATVAQTLRPFPQFNDGLAARWAPLGNTWYDALHPNLRAARLSGTRPALGTGSGRPAVCAAYCALKRSGLAMVPWGSANDR